MIGACVATISALCAGYVSVGGPIPATRTYVIAQANELKARLIDNSIQTNKLQLDLLRKEQIDRQVQIRTENNEPVRQLYQERLNAVNDSISTTIDKNKSLERERQDLAKTGQ
jgi:hypothetical protein